MYTHIRTNTCTDNRKTTKNIHHIYQFMTTHQDHIIYMYTVYYYCNFNTIIHNNNNITQFDEYSSYRILALLSHVPCVTF